MENREYMKITIIITDKYKNDKLSENKIQYKE